MVRAIQLLKHWGAKVSITSCSADMSCIGAHPVLEYEDLKSNQKYDVATGKDEGILLDMLKLFQVHFTGVPVCVPH